VEAHAITAERPSAPPDVAPVFSFDLASPECYLAAERVASVLPTPPEWEPVVGDRRSWQIERSAIERLALERGLQPIRWPSRWPPESQMAMRAATYAKSIGRVTAFALAAFRQAFAGGRDLDDSDTIVIAGAACEIHPSALLKGIELRSVGSALEQAIARACAAGVRSLPAIAVGRVVFEGDAGLDEAAKLLGGGR
jgi:2-hydroxychromene-2-carboxylate isomerase